MLMQAHCNIKIKRREEWQHPSVLFSSPYPTKGHEVESTELAILTLPLPRQTEELNQTKNLPDLAGLGQNLWSLKGLE